MIFVFGGAYQGKLDFVRRAFGAEEQEICYCGEAEAPDFSKRVLYGIEQWTYGLTARGGDPDAWFAEHLPAFRDKILICTDISRGLVPMDVTERAWREANGRCMNRLAAAADEVYSVFCGIEQRIK